MPGGERGGKRGPAPQAGPRDRPQSDTFRGRGPGQSTRRTASSGPPRPSPGVRAARGTAPPGNASGHAARVNWPATCSASGRIQNFKFWPLDVPRLGGRPVQSSPISRGHGSPQVSRPRRADYVGPTGQASPVHAVYRPHLADRPGPPLSPPKGGWPAGRPVQSRAGHRQVHLAAADRSIKRRIKRSKPSLTQIIPWPQLKQIQGWLY